MTLSNVPPLSMSEISGEFGLGASASMSQFLGKGGAPSAAPLSLSDMLGRANAPITASINPPSRSTGSQTVAFSTTPFTASVSSGTPTSYSWAVVENNSGGAAVVSGGNTATANLRSSNNDGGAPDKFSCTIVVNGVAYVGFCTKLHTYIAGGTQ